MGCYLVNNKEIKRLCLELGGVYYTYTCEVPLSDIVKNVDKVKKITEIINPFIIRGHYECDTYTLEFYPPKRIIARRWGEGGAPLGDREEDELLGRIVKLHKDVEKDVKEAVKNKVITNVSYKFDVTSGTVRAEIIITIEGSLDDIEYIIKGLWNVRVLCENIEKTLEY